MAEDIKEFEETELNTRTKTGQVRYASDDFAKYQKEYQKKEREMQKKLK